ncbi:hypothetical protein [Spirosoma areae]
MENQSYRPNYFDLSISFFEYDRKRNMFANVPSQQTTLRRIVSTRFYQAPVEQIRTERDKAKQDELKKLLPAFTPVALLNHRKKDTSFEDKIKDQWPMLMGDVDKKDNRHRDMAELKRHIASLPYILLCAYSVRGGLWFVVRLPDHQTPKTLAAHFRYLQKLFIERFFIPLDNTKGGNPTDLRFVSYDPTPFLNENASVMSGVYTPPPPKIEPVYYNRFRSENDSQLLPRLVRFAQTAGEGGRHVTLLRAAKLAGGWIAAGRMDEQTALYALETVASEWPTFNKSQKTIRDGLRYGLQQPIYEETPYELPHHVPDPVKVRQPYVRSDESVIPRLTITQQRPVVTWSSSFIAPPLAWCADKVYQFIHWAVIPNGYVEDSWPPQEPIHQTNIDYR